jgi:Ni,Fe-hydrogenase III component G
MSKTIKAGIANLKSRLGELRAKGARLVAISDVGNQVIYHLELKQDMINLKVELGARKELDSVTDMFPNAILYEREIAEKRGLRFKGHPDPRRLFT